jgi:hypothetical protein
MFHQNSEVIVGNNGGDHPYRREKTMIQIDGRPATWVHRLVIARFLVKGKSE